MKRGLPVEGVSLDEARAIKAAVTIPVLSTGGWQTASKVRDAITSGAFDGVSIARSLVANPDLVQWWAGPRAAGEALHLLQPLPAQRAEEPDGLLRAAALRRHDAMVERADDHLRARPICACRMPAEV